MGSLVELLGVERATKTQGDALSEEDVVGKGSNTTVVDLDLYFGARVSHAFPQHPEFDCTNLGERDRVDAVLAGNLKADSVAGLRVPGSLGTSLDL